MKNKYSWMLLGLAVIVGGFFIGKHYYTKAYAEREIDAFIQEQGVPSKAIYDEKFVWDWMKSGDYVKNFKVRGDSADMVYQYIFIGKGQDVLFMPYSSTSDEPDVKYPPAKTEDDFNLYLGEAYEDGDSSLYVQHLKLFTGTEPSLDDGKYVLHKTSDIFDADGKRIEADEIKKGDALKIYLSENTAVKETSPAQIDGEYIFKIVREK
ncbi:DUF3139 domain-containing protein [Listeria newyorkensis]|uniref:DUF3139 domain-containing protein n=1 Tax=Listeria newyorkensis TaxID=1497681 RepID=A0A841YTF4_9LIST|nr:DUF3139 domain-containing protein [Listeria newyorkensis]MBC1457031.1 DUF3139 domain-containing protein [Listeria newyorkensis]